MVEKRRYMRAAFRAIFWGVTTLFSPRPIIEREQLSVLSHITYVAPNNCSSTTGLGAQCNSSRMRNQNHSQAVGGGKRSQKESFDVRLPRILLDVIQTFAA